MRSFIGLLLLVAGCGGVASQVRPTVVIEEGELILHDESSDQVPLEIRFELDSAEVGAESRRPLEVLAEFITSHGGLPLIEVQGHTDEQGTAAHNMGLSERRARAVVAILVEEGVEPARLRARGYGDTRPVSRAHSPAARALNRRVQFVMAPQ